MMDDSSNDAIDLHLAKLLDEHLLRDRGNRPLKLREAEHLAAEEMKQDQQLPATLQDPEGVLDTLGRRSWGEATSLTLG